MPHRLFGHVDGAQQYSAAVWAEQARAAITEAHQAGRLPILVGGTGLYLRTLLDGIAPVPEIAPEIRAAVRALPVAEAHRRLAQVDPLAAAHFAPADTTRVARALEVVMSTGRTLATWQQYRAGGIGNAVALAPLILLPERARLFAACDARFETMMAQGAAEEVRALLARGDIAPSAPVRRAIGVCEIAGWLGGDYDVKTAITAAQLATRRYAKRQFTWFRNQPPKDWERANEIENNALINKIDRLLL